jgi:hypothetical protein
MTWQAVAAAVLALCGRTTLSVPMPRIYQDEAIIVTVRPAMDLDLDYVGVSLLVRPRPRKGP